VAQEPLKQVPGDAEDTPADTATNDATEAEAKAKETPVDTPIEVIEEEGTTEADIDEEYVLDVTAAQGTWDPWPTSSQDDPTTLQDDPAPAQDD